MNEKHKGAPGPRLRSKRGQYVNQACTYCKRRKTKCDGEQPCKGCSSLRRKCEYQIPRSPSKSSLTSPRSIAKRDGITPSSHTLGCDHGAARGDSMSEPNRLPLPNSDTRPVQTVSDPLQDVPEFCGPSSSEFTLKAVSGNLKEMGMPSAILSKPTSDRGNSSGVSSHFSNYGPLMKLVTMDPLRDIPKTDTIALVEKWFTSMGSLYPFLSQERILDTVERVYAAIEPVSAGASIPRRESAAEALLNDETNKLKLILAVGRTMEHGGKNDQAQRLFQSTTEAVESLIWNPNGIGGIQLLVLTAIYHYQIDEEICTGRIIGLAARLCLEMGLHRHATIEKVFANHEDRTTALSAFWSVYMLERRINLGQGIPYLIQDSYIDQSLFTQDNSNPVLRCLLQWTKLVGKAWKIMNIEGENGTEVQVDELEYLDFQVGQWFDELPHDLKLDTSLVHSDSLSTSLFVPATLYLRQSLLRNLIFRPVLQSASRIAHNDKHAHLAVAHAKEAVSTLHKLSAHRPFILSHALFFKHLLLAAFGNLLLAVVHAHVLFWDTIQPDFIKALDLIQLLSTRSAPMARLWQRLQGLRELPARLSELSNSVPSSNLKAGQLTRFNELRGTGDFFPASPMDSAFFNLTQPFEQLPREYDFLCDIGVGPGGFLDFSFLEYEMLE